MKVISQPEPRKQWTTTAKCVGHLGVRIGCGATVEVTEDDLFRVDRQIRPNSSDTHAHAEMECPICHVWSDVENYPQAEVLPVYSNWLFLKNGMGVPSYDLPGYYAAPMKPTWRRVPENLEPQITSHLRFMTAGNTR